MDGKYDEKQVLINVSMDICENTFTGIVGESGSGKSTVVSLIMGRNTIKQGTLTVAGINVADINEDSLFGSINYVGIGSTFFKGTVRENLLLAAPKTSDENCGMSSQSAI